jgi:outer membrane autotransporter protein
LNDAIDHEEEFLATARRPQSYIKKSSCPPQSFNYSFWVDGFGDWSHQKSYKTTPSFDVSTRGALLGFEYFAEIGLVETAFAYAHSDSKLGMPSGHGSTDYYCGSVYWTVYPWDTAYLEVGIWGVYNTFKNTREISFPGFHTTSRSAHHGWQLMPHLSFGYDFVYDWAVLQPFVTLDWDFIHQSGFKEHGGAYVNFRERASTASVLRSQIGLSGYEIVKQTNEWTVIIKETLSAVNRDPFHLGKAKANLAGSSAWISLNEPFASQYLFAPLLELYVKHSSGVYADITYRGEFGSGYRTNGGYVQVGAFF